MVSGGVLRVGESSQGVLLPGLFYRIRFLPLFRRFQALIGYGWYNLSSLVLTGRKEALFAVFVLEYAVKLQLGDRGEPWQEARSIKRQSLLATAME